MSENCREKSSAPFLTHELLDPNKVWAPLDRGSSALLLLLLLNLVKLTSTFSPDDLEEEEDAQTAKLLRCLFDREVKDRWPALGRLAAVGRRGKGFAAADADAARTLLDDAFPPQLLLLLQLTLAPAILSSKLLLSRQTVGLSLLSLEQR